MAVPPLSPLAEVLRNRVAEGDLYFREPDGRLRCLACGHRCLIGEGRQGICKVRFNREGRLMTPKGYVGALQCDPVEKKPFFHVLPGSDALTFGMLGCDLHCGYCQNWVTSQALRDLKAVSPVADIAAERLAELAAEHHARIVASSYNEPLITAEWAMDVFRAARALGLRTAFVSNGNATPEALNYIRPWTDCYKVDLKSMSDRRYRELGGVLNNVLESIRLIAAMGLWIEVVTLTVPGFNDSTEELRDAARFVASISKDIPWHVTAFHQDYRMRDQDATTAAALIRACEIGKEEGLRYVYAGNLPGQVGAWEDTFCHSCGELLIARRGFLILHNHLTASHSCPRCDFPLPGVWTVAERLSEG